MGASRLTTETTYHRCDACEYVFAVDESGTSRLRDATGDHAVQCPACRGEMRIVGMSGDPLMVHYECTLCSDVVSRPPRQ